MENSWRIQEKGFIFCLTTIYQEVSASGGDCLNELCFAGIQQQQLSEWVIILIVILGILICLSCCFTICKCCCHEWQPDEETEPTESRVNPFPPPPAFAPPIPSGPPMNQSEELPSYDEIVQKPYHFPPPLELPPAYDNIAMTRVSSPDISQLPGSMPKDTF